MMKTKNTFKVTVFMFFLYSLALLLAGCGGGGSSGSSYYSGKSGSVALYIKDAPVDNYDKLLVYIEEVSLISAGESQPPVIIFKSNDPGGYEIDLLDLRDQDMLFTIHDEVPVGFYEKIRLKIYDIIPFPKAGMADACDPADMEIKLPSGKIDLNPQGGIDVMTGQTLSIRLDIDANKSINLHPAGNSGKCIFRPVVFVDIEPVSEKPQISCLQLLEGTIDELLYREANIVGFVMELPDDRGPLNVYIDNAVIFDDNGSPILAQDLDGKIGSAVSVRGKLDDQAAFQANLVVLGQVVGLKGTVGAAVDNNLQFPLDIMPGQELEGLTAVTVALSADSLILTGCEQVVDPSYIQKDMLARVVGRYDIGQQLFHAYAVILQPVQVTGKLDAILIENGIKTITVRTESGSTVDVVMPKDVPPMLEGDGIISDELFECAVGKDIKVALDPEKPLHLTALEVRVQPDTINATVSDVFIGGWYESTIEAMDDQQNELTINVAPTSTLLKSIDDSLLPAALYEIINGDQIRVFALPLCTDNVIDYSAFIILVYPPPPP